ncbi:MAG: HAD family hydrolase [Gemmatimonadetes bacterium]|nr:HAD family hydrolase [Gemmatimonadota bacterium]
MSARTLTAVVWDFDGTLVDSRRRNYNVVRRIMAEVAQRPLDSFPALRDWSVYDQVNRSYANWRDLYAREFGFSEEETDRVGRMWTRYQMEDDTVAPVFDGVATVLAALAFVPHGIVSMNGRHQIARSLREANLQDRFRHIVGWEDVDIRRQKPAPDGLLDCLRALTACAPGMMLYLGDHQTDIRCAHNARAALAETDTPVEIVTVAVSFTGSMEFDNWPHRPDYAARHPHDVIEVARRLHEAA